MKKVARYDLKAFLRVEGGTPVQLASRLLGLMWELLLALEPRLADLERDIRAVKRPRQGPFCANAWWYGKFKPRLVPLVGWVAKARPEGHVLRGRATYEYRVFVPLLSVAGQPGLQLPLG